MKKALNPSLVAAILPQGVPSIELASAEQLCQEANKYLHHTTVVAGEPLRKSHLFSRLVNEAIERMDKAVEAVGKGGSAQSSAVDSSSVEEAGTNVSKDAVVAAPFMDGWRAHLPMRTSSSTKSTGSSTSSSSLSYPALTYEDAVEFMCMLVAIDFRHWHEEPGSYAENDGEVVKKIDFWTNKEVCGGESGVIRGSMAMTHLLKSAPVSCRWYDSEFLTSGEHCGGGTVVGITEALTPVIFTGCKKEDVSQPMPMPAIPERVQVLHELAHTFKARKESNSNSGSFVSILNECGGYLYTASIPNNNNKAGSSSVGFIDGLFQLSERFNDSSVVKKKKVQKNAGDGSTVKEEDGMDDDDEKTVYFFKLAQLTVIALESAFPLGHGVNEVDGLVFGEKFKKEKNLINTTNDDLSSSCWWHNGIQFKDRHLLKVCSDYQLPRALWASGILTYDEHLTKIVKEHRLIGVNSVEEVDIRLGSTVASLALMEEANKYLSEENEKTREWLNATSGNGAAVNPQQEKRRKEEILLVDTGRLDFVLWEEGRNKTSADLPHHLTRTIMY